MFLHISTYSPDHQAEVYAPMSASNDATSFSDRLCTLQTQESEFLDCIGALKCYATQAPPHAHEKLNVVHANCVALKNLTVKLKVHWTDSLLKLFAVS